MSFKNINVKLIGEQDQDIIEFLDNKPVKFIFTEAVRMYMKNYKAMQDGPIIKAEPENKLNKFLGK